MPFAADLYYHVHQGGNGGKPPVVFLHGAGGNHLYWPAQLRHLPGYRTFALDLPGHGKSGGHGRQSIVDYANSVVDWLEAIELHRAVFAGHSMGSAIVQTLALDYSERVSGLILVGSGARLRVDSEILQNAANQTTFLTAVTSVVNRSFSEQADLRLVELAARRMAEVRPSVYHGDLLACERFDLIEQVAEIHQPTLVICGADDQMTPPRYAQFLSGTISAARLEIIPGAGHMVMLEQPDLVTSVIKEFLDDHFSFGEAG